MGAADGPPPPPSIDKGSSSGGAIPAFLHPLPDGALMPVTPNGGASGIPDLERRKFYELSWA